MGKKDGVGGEGWGWGEGGRAGEEGRVLGVLLTSLQGPPVTLTALGLFQITRPLILTLSGIILTYFVILIQLT